MALINPKFYTGPALIVGDGNFSFSACLTQSLGEMRTEVFATSLDTQEQVETNLFAKENLDKISAFSSFNVIHGVDATNLEATFKDKIFHKIIFNFPHTGGKLKISKCRDLLEKFFMSASRHIEPTRGVVCVSLCQGQGGTPQDSIQRDYGNTWQVVQQAAKAGLILNDVHPFREADYPGYSSAGFKGRLNQRFTADKGLTYMFTHGSPLQPTPDLQSFLKMRKTASNSCKSLFLIDNHPVSKARRKIETFCKTENRDKFDIRNDHEEGNEVEYVTSLEDKLASTLKLSSTNINSFYDDIVQLIKEKDAFVASGIESDFSVPASSGFYPISHYTVISKSFATRTPFETIQSEVDRTLSALFNGVCPGISCTKASPNLIPSMKDDLSFPKCQLNLFKPMDYQRLRERKRNFMEWRPVKKLHCCCNGRCNSPESDAKIDSVKEETSDNGKENTQEKVNERKQIENNEEDEVKKDNSETEQSGKKTEIHTKMEHDNKKESDTGQAMDTETTSSAIKKACTICQLEDNYFSKERSTKISDILEESTIGKVHHKERVLFTYGFVKQEEFEHSAWVILAHLDYLAMALYDIPDIRILWSKEKLFLQQFERENEDSFVSFIPFSLFPPIYIHDISFWLTADSTESNFFQAIQDVAGNLISDVWFRERYIDEIKHQVSYNYRMVYWRCDGPLSHIQTVEIQNLLRLVLLDLNFHLS